MLKISIKQIYEAQSPSVGSHKAIYLNTTMRLLKLIINTHCSKTQTTHSHWLLSLITSRCKTSNCWERDNGKSQALGGQGWVQWGKGDRVGERASWDWLPELSHRAHVSFPLPNPAWSHIPPSSVVWPMLVLRLNRPRGGYSRVDVCERLSTACVCNVSELHYGGLSMLPLSTSAMLPVNKPYCDS